MWQQKILPGERTSQSPSAGRSGMSFVDDPPESTSGAVANLWRCRFRTLSSWDREPYTPKAINVRLPELTGETDLVSIDSRDTNAEIGVFIFPK